MTEEKLRELDRAMFAWLARWRSTRHGQLGLARTSYLNANAAAKRAINRRILLEIRAERPRISKPWSWRAAVNRALTNKERGDHEQQ